MTSHVGEEYAEHKKSLDQVPLEQFNWVLEVSESPSDEQESPAHESGPQCNGQPHSSNGASPNGQQVPVNGQHQSSHGALPNGQQVPVNGQHQSSNGASPNEQVSGQHQSSNGSSPNQPGASGKGQEPSSSGQPPNGAAPRGREGPAYGPRPPSHTKAQPTQSQLQDLNALAFVLKQHLPKDLADRLWRTAAVCCVPQNNMSVDAAQEMISAVLDEAETLQTQIITETWYVVVAKLPNR